MKNKELKKFSDEELLVEIIHRSGSKKGLPIKAKCFKCSSEFGIKGNNTTQAPSKLSSGEYGSGEKTSDKICGSCLRSLRKKRPLYLQSIRSTSKRRMLSAYLVSNRI